MASPNLQEYAIMAGMEPNQVMPSPSASASTSSSSTRPTLALDIGRAQSLQDRIDSTDNPFSPKSPSSMFGKSTIEHSKGCVIITALLSYWDNILGPRIHHQWCVQGETIKTETLTYVASHTLSGEICRNVMDSNIDTLFCVVKDRDLVVTSFIFSAVDKGDMAVHSLSLLVRHANLKTYLAVQELCVEWNTRLVGKLRVLMEKESNETMITCFSGYLTKFIQMLNAMKDAGVPKDIPLCDSAFHPEHRLNEVLLRRAITSHLITCGRSVVIGNSMAKINVMVATLAMFLSPSHRARCRYASENSSSGIYHPDLLIQGILIGGDSDLLAVSLQDTAVSRYPSSIINLATSTVQLSALPHHHTPRRQAALLQDLHTLWHGSFSEDYPTSDMFHSTDDPETLVKNFIDELFLLPPTNGLRESYVNQFVSMLERKAVSLLKYVKAEMRTHKGSRNDLLKSLRHGLALSVPGDFYIVLACAETLKPGISDLLCGEGYTEAAFKHYLQQIK